MYQTPAGSIYKSYPAIAHREASVRNVPLIAKLQGQYAVFGRVVKGMDVVHRRPSATRY